MFPLENPPLVLCGDTMVLFDDFYTYIGSGNSGNIFSKIGKKTA
jgi:hypothetical protein